MEDGRDKIWDCIEYLEATGYLIRPDVEADKYIKPRHLPFALYPATMKKTTMSLITTNQEIFNRLIFQATANVKFMQETMRPIIENDNFWAKLYDIWSSVESKNKNQIKLGLNRVDYMLERENNVESPYLVEFNTIASGAGALCSGVSDMHKVLNIKPNINEKSWPHRNNVLNDVLVHGLANAVKIYSNKYSTDLTQLCIVVICEEKPSANFCDQNKIQRATQAELNYLVDCIKISYSKFRKLSRFVKDRIYLNEKEVALVYYRSGYDPSCYKDEDSWSTRRDIEHSRAVKCPPMEFHLATNKIFQAAFMNEAIATKYISKSEFDLIRQTFPETCSLEDFSSPLIKEAKRNSKKFCLKILREGGAAGNLFGKEIESKLAEMETNTQERSKYILMRYLRPVQSENILVINGNIDIATTVTEHSTFGGILIDEQKVIYSTNDGQLIRTKRAELTSGGLMNGAATINSLHLTD